MKVLLLVFLVISQGSKASDTLYLDENKNFRFQKVIELGGNKDELFTKAKLWFAETIVDAKQAIQMEDKENGIIAGKVASVFEWKSYTVKKNKVVYYGDTWGKNSDQVQFNVRMFFKDGKAKIILSDITILDRWYDFRNIVYGQPLIDSVKRLSLGTVKNQAQGKSLESKIDGLNKEIKELVVNIEKGLTKKREDDF